jgi:hypothetical protein
MVVGDAGTDCTVVESAFIITFRYVAICDLRVARDAVAAVADFGRCASIDMQIDCQSLFVAQYATTRVDH